MVDRLSNLWVSMTEFVWSFGLTRFVVWLLALVVVCFFVRNRIAKGKEGAVAFYYSQEIEETGRPMTKISKNVEQKVREHYFFIDMKYLLIGAVSVIVVTFTSFFAFRFPISSSPAEWGQMGDFFGGMLNPILAFASFIALLYTIRIQSEELKLTREEFAKSVEAQRDVVEEHRNNLIQNKINTKVSVVTEILRAKIREVDELLLKIEGDPTSFSVYPTIMSMYRQARSDADSLPNSEWEPSLKDCRSLESKFKNYINNERQTYSKGFSSSLDNIQRILSVSDYYLQQLVDDSDVDEFYVRVLQGELQRPAAILYLAGKVSWNCYKNINMSIFLDGQKIGGYPVP